MSNLAVTIWIYFRRIGDGKLRVRSLKQNGSVTVPIVDGSVSR